MRVGSITQDEAVGGQRRASNCWHLSNRQVAAWNGWMRIVCSLRGTTQWPVCLPCRQTPWWCSGWLGPRIRTHRSTPATSTLLELAYPNAPQGVPCHHRCTTTLLAAYACPPHRAQYLCLHAAQSTRQTHKAGGMLQPNAGQTLSRQLLSRTDPPLLPRRSTDTGRRQVTGHRPHPHLSTSSHTAWPPKAEPRSLHGARASTPRTDPLGRGNIDRAGRR